VGRALKELGVQMIPAYSPQARGRSERNFGTWQGRLPQELRLAGIATLEQANSFLRASYIGEFNQKFTAPAAENETAFRRTARRDLNWIFSAQTERVVAKDNTVAIADQHWQLEKTRFRSSLAGCTVTIHEHLDGLVSVRYGPHVVGRYQADGSPRGKPKAGFPPLRFLLSWAQRSRENPERQAEGNKRISCTVTDRSRVNKSGQLDLLTTADTHHGDYGDVGPCCDSPNTWPISSITYSFAVTVTLLLCNEH
jgi:hypothetical protein